MTMPRSARGLLFTVLGELVLPGGGTAWTSSVLDVLGRLGVEQKAARQALMRTANAGWLAAERHGRRTRWRLTPRAERLLADGARRIYGFAGPAADWDGRVALVLARIPATDRALRHRLRTQLGWAGFASPAPGVWVSPHVHRLGEAERLLADGGIEDVQAFAAEPAGAADLAGMIGRAWDLDAVEAEYARFLVTFAAGGPDDPLAGLVELVHAWRRFPSIDPALPRQLVPSPWSGGRAATLFQRRHAEWAAGAAAEWARLEGSQP